MSDDLDTDEAIFMADLTRFLSAKPLVNMLESQGVLYIRDYPGSCLINSIQHNMTKQQVINFIRLFGACFQNYDNFIVACAR